jgi:ring-1,2-phenylacetyl-CoA epoxidase subunit PaaD
MKWEKCLELILQQNGREAWRQEVRNTMHSGLKTNNMANTKLTKDEVLQWLEQVKDPEIPVLSLVDLGVITDIEINPNQINIEMTPTFVGCPAIHLMKEEIVQVIRSQGIKNVSVNISFKKPWSSDMISEKGKVALKQFGLAPPPASSLISDIDLLEHAQCPRCNSINTEIKSPFGSTLCRSIHYCLACKEAFEQFKPL